MAVKKTYTESGDASFREIGDDENLLFSEAMKDVKRLSRKKSLVEKERAGPRFSVQKRADAKKLLEETLEDAYTIDVINLPEYMEGHVEEINPVTVEKLRNGEFSIQRTLDLHGYGLKTAEKMFEEFLKEAVISGLQCVRIIHGRGLKSTHKPVLKENLKKWITRAMHRKWIIAFSSCKMCDGGPGATDMLLRKKSVKKRIRIVG